MENKQTIIKRIVNIVREGVLKDDQIVWNEEIHGAAWLDNEITIATEMLGTLNNKVYASWENYNTVEEFTSGLRRLSFDDLKFILKVFEAGGTSCEDIIKCNRKDKDDVRNACILCGILS